MICSSCVTFIGNPCAACRTYTRIGLLLRGRLVPAQEGRALDILRVAAGSLQDLVETSGRASLGVYTAPPIPGEAVEGTAPLNPPAAAVGAAEKKAEAELSKEPLNEIPKVHPEQGDKKVKKDKKKKKSPEREEKPGVEETPAEAAKPEVEAEEKKEKKKPEGDKREKRTGIPAASSRIRSPREEVQTQVDRYVAENPNTFGLGSLPVKGSAGRHFIERAGRDGRERPPEPEHPPSASRHGVSRGDRQASGRSRSRSKKKKSKGRAHRERGRLWRQQHHNQRSCRQR